MSKANDILSQLKNEHSKLAEIANDENPINISHFRSFTGGNRKQERELFELFISTVTSCLKLLKDNMQEDMSTIWQESAHRLKGASANLGANNLSQLCKQAEDTITLADKEKIYIKIEIACNAVIDQISSM